MAVNNEKVFSGLVYLPKGRADDTVIEGCIVLEGGAFRGVYGEGVLDALMEAGINMQTTIGTSAGALNGMNYVSGQIGRSARINLEYRHDSRYVGRQALIHNGGVVGFDFALQQDLEDNPFDMERFMDPRRRFIAVVTNIATGKAEYMEKGKVDNILKAIQASASMPIFSRAVEIDGQYYLDGGCADKIAFQWALDQGFKKIVVVKTQPDDYRKPPMSEKEKKAFNTVFRNHPQFCDVFAKSNDLYNEQCDEIARQHRRKNLFAIAPSEYIPVSRLEKDMEKLGRLYYLGYHDGRKIIPALKEYLEID
ncbi:patatin family protein [uncultured Dubosiella sp.]|uniref:patatin-like phospholipase family protein n=1 Tax=uncultured Dubosiella sp. TaxID=1937011 RepID=UPI0025B31134|nr:patatin family protein [uncultured Dubosiella sp.]